MITNRQKGYLCIVTAAVMWGFIGPLGKMAYSQGVTPLEVAFWRALLAWFCFGTEMVILHRKTDLSITRTDLPKLALFSILCVTLFYWAYQVAVDQGGAALASVLLYTAPAWVILFSGLFLREKITTDKLLALAMTSIGVALIAFSQSGSPAGVSGKSMVLGIVAGLFSGFCYSLYYILGKFFAARYSAGLLFFYTLLPGALLMLPWITFVSKTGTAWLSLVLLAVISTYGAYHCYYAGLRYIEAGRASIVATLEPVVAALAAWYWWGEFFTVTGYSGALLIMVAVLLVIRR